MRRMLVGIAFLALITRADAEEYFVPDSGYVDARCAEVGLLARGTQIANKIRKAESDEALQKLSETFSDEDHLAYGTLIAEFADENIISAWSGYDFPLILAKDDANRAAAKVVKFCRRRPSKAEEYETWLAELEKRISGLIELVWCGTCSAIASPSAREPLPRGFNSYTLLLVPSSEWTAESMDEEMQTLFESFIEFGESIGRKEAAVWLRDPKGGGIDIRRSKDYCDKFGLSYNGGPYLVFTKQRPDLPLGKESPIVVRLSGISQDGVIRVLNVLAADLRNQRTPTQGHLLLAELRQWVGSALERNAELIKDLVVSVVK